MVLRTSIPYRIGLIGGGTDLPYFTEEHGAAVINASFKAYSHCEIRKIQSPHISIDTQDYQKTIEITQLPELALIKSPEFRITVAVLNFFYRELEKLNTGLSIKTHSDFKPQTGLGGSSAHLVAVLKSTLELIGLNWDNTQILATAHQIERQILKIFGGFQDFYPCVHQGSHFLTKTAMDPVYHTPLDSNFLNSLDLDFYLVPNHGAAMETSATLPDTHSLKEQKNFANEAAFAWKEGNATLFKRLLQKSWSIKDNQPTQVNNPAVFARKTCGLSKAMNIYAVEKSMTSQFQEKFKDEYRKIEWH